MPSHAFRDTLEQLAAAACAPAQRVAWATKGFELGTGLLPHQVAREVLGAGRADRGAVGPDLRARGRRGTADRDDGRLAGRGVRRRARADLSGQNFRAYTSTDIVGVEVGGAVKNVLAIGAGIADGMGFGANTRIALITRGLVEMTRLGVALGARRETFMGLAGARRPRADLHRRPVAQPPLRPAHRRRRDRRPRRSAEIGQVVEGVHAARAVRAVAARAGVEMPIAEQVYGVLYEGRDVARRVRAADGPRSSSATAHRPG